MRSYRLDSGREFFFALPADFDISDVQRIHEHLLAQAHDRQEATTQPR